MVTVTNYFQRKNSEGKSFIVLEIEGGLQVIQSPTTGNLYASVSKCTIPCSFDEPTAQRLIGTTMPGTIEKVPCKPYSYVSPKTKEMVTLDYKYHYKEAAAATSAITEEAEVH